MTFLHSSPFSLPCLRLSALVVLVCMATTVAAVGPIRVAITTFTGGGNQCNANSINYEFHQRQYCVSEYIAAVTNNMITLNNAVASLRDVFEIPQPSVAISGCTNWHNHFKTLLPSGANTATYDSYVWVLPPFFTLTGCNTTDADVNGAISQRGPCGAGGCYNFYRKVCPTTSDMAYAFGRNLGLSRSNGRANPAAAVVVGGDYSCPMGQVFDLRMSEGIARRGFNALKLRDLGIITSTETTSFGTFTLSSPYVYDGVLGRIRLLRITGTPYYLSFRSPVSNGPDRNINFATRYMFAPTLTSLVGNIHIHELAADGSSNFVGAVYASKTFSLTHSGVTWQIKHFFNNNNEVTLGISSTGTLPTTPVQVAVTIPDSGTVWSQVAILDTAEQGSIASDRAYSASALLDLNWTGDERNSTVFVRVQVPVPRGATIQAATLMLESDQIQQQGLRGSNVANVAIESVDNAVALSGDVLRRSVYAPSLPKTFSGDWETGDEIPVDVTSLITAITARVGWVANNYVNIRIQSAVVDQSFSRTVKSGVSCTSYGSTTPCAPRLRIQYTTGGGAPVPPPIDCQSIWSAWSECTGGTCGGTGSQFRTQIITVPASNGGAPCSAETRQTQACPRESCATTPPAQPIDCVVSYGAWSACLGPCSTGTGQRSRQLFIVTQAANGGRACPVSLVEIDSSCQTAVCPPQNCVIAWSNPTPCVGQCGSTGTQNRTATVVVAPLYGGTPCPSLFEILNCQMPACSQDCVVSFAGATWSNCQRICQCPCANGNNEGVQQLVGTITQQQIGNGAPCPSTTVTRSCVANVCTPVDCQFVWSGYSDCVGPCGNKGTQSRYATIYAQPVSGGAACPFPTTETRSCSTAPCGGGTPTYAFFQSPVLGSVVGPTANLVSIDFQYVTVTEAQGFMEVTWLFIPPAAGELDLVINVGAQYLQGQNLVFSWAFSGDAFQDCLIVSSEPARSYTVVLTSNAATRRVVQIKLTNSVHNLRPIDTKVFVDYMAIMSYESTGPAPIDCVQTSLVAEGPCSNSCGSGTQCFTRQTLVPAANGGRACEPTRVCNACNSAVSCPVDCVISAFGPPSACSSLCGYGFTISTATILVNPANGGKPCPSLTRTSLCYAGSCSTVQNCQWGNWSAWSTCTAPCGGGFQTHFRAVAVPATGGGAPCDGPSTQTQSCNTQACGGNVKTVLVTSQFISSGADKWQVWPATATPVPNVSGVSINTVGRATDQNSLNLSNGFFQLVSGAGAVCSVTSIVLACPQGTPSTSIIANVLGRLQCQGSVSASPQTANATFTITC